MTLRLNILLTALLSFSAASVSAFAQPSKVVPDSLGAKQAAAHSLAELLEGEVAGVRVSRNGASPLSPVSVDIRGTSTLRGDDQPLWIVDGAVIENSSGLNLNPFWNYSDLGRISAVNTFFHLSPDDVESIEVLKDASATALYGSRGAAGVIIVKTKLAPDRGREKGVQLKSNLGYALDGGFFHNYYLNAGMSKRSTSFNSSLSYRSFASGADGIGANELSFRSSLETRAAKVMWFGVNFMGGIGSFDNSGTSLEDFQDDGKRYGATASAWLRFNLFPGLDWTTTAGGDYRSVNRFIWYGTKTPVGAAYNGLAGITNNTALSYNVNSALNFKRYFAVKHGVEAQLGVDFYGVHNLYNSLAANDYLAEELKARGISISNGTRPTWLYTESLGHYALFARVGYNFDDIFGLNASYRADKTFTAYDGRFDQYPAVDARLDLRKIFFASSKAISTLSLEGGFGFSGNEKNLLYPFLDTAVDSVPEVEKARRGYINARSLQRLKEWTLGLRAGFISQRIVLEGKYFNRVVNDSFDIFDSAVMDTDEKWQKGTPVLMSASTSSFTARGFELSLSASVIRTRNLEWTLRGNFTRARTQVVRVDGADSRFNPGYVGSGYFAANVTGAPVGAIMGFEVDSDGHYKDNVPDGVINESDCVMLGNLLPEMYGGFGTTLRLYGFTLDMAADYAAAFNLIDGASMRAENRTMLTARYVSRGDYLRLSRVALSYDIPLPESAVKSLSLSLSGHNLFTLSRFAGAYPDASPFGLQPLARGNDWEGRPLHPSVILGLGIKF